jgi:hypothetical protein
MKFFALTSVLAESFSLIAACAAAQPSSKPAVGLANARLSKARIKYMKERKLFFLLFYFFLNRNNY